MNIAVYISGHGFGHLAQVAPVLNCLHELHPDCRFLIRSALPEPEMKSRFNFGFDCEQTPVDVGVVQKNAVEEDRHASIEQMRNWLRDFDEQVEREITRLSDFQADLVLSDVSPLAFPAARALTIPGIGLATLDWHTIYSHWLDAHDPMIKQLAAAYACCDLLITPPMAMDMAVFPHQMPIELIAAKPAGIANPLAGDGRKQALVLFGGCGNPPFDIQALETMRDWLFLIPDAPANSPANVHSIHFGTDLRAVDLMPYVDVVICKPGYGVLAECWQTNRPIAWVERPDFPEFPMLRTWLMESFPSAGMSRHAFATGNWIAALDAAMACQRQFPVLGDGAAQAAEMLLGLCRYSVAREV